jgi:predicted dinucleotide-binding enzyme
MSTKSVAIIGAGQLGSRHLQGLLKSKLTFDVYAVDPNEQARNTAETRATEIEHGHKLHFDAVLDNLPRQLDFVIVATNSNIRFKVLKALLEQSQVDVLVLEKVLFQKDEEYYQALSLLEAHEVKTYVNHPRRMQSFYNDLKSHFNGIANDRIQFSAYGVNWGLGCNGLHLSDLLSYLFEDQTKDYTTQYLDKAILESKREGYAEFTGTLRGHTEKGVSFEISSIRADDNEVLPISISIYTPSLRVFIQEGASTTISIFNADNGYQLDSNTYPMLFQSDLSMTIVEQALEGKVLDLTSYGEAMTNHLLFTKAIRDFYNEQNNTKVERCPIT